MTSQHDKSGPALIIEASRWRAALYDLERVVARLYRMAQRYKALPRHRPPPAIVFSDNRRVKSLNFRFRGRNKATNVLTFDPLTPAHGGDIILAFETIEKEAQNAKRSFRAHVTHLLLHGLLHLAGHDHHHPGEARRMETLETYILRRMGFADPWRQGGKIGG